MIIATITTDQAIALFDQCPQFAHDGQWAEVETLNPKLYDGIFSVLIIPGETTQVHTFRQQENNSITIEIENSTTTLRLIDEEEELVKITLPNRKLDL